MTAEFFGEFGFASIPALESIMRYLPDDEKDIWPPEEDGTLAYHTPAFNKAQDLSRLMQYASYYLKK